MIEQATSSRPAPGTDPSPQPAAKADLVRLFVAARAMRSDATLAPSGRAVLGAYRRAQEAAIPRWAGATAGQRRVLGILAVLGVLAYPYAVDSTYWAYVALVAIVGSVIGLSLMVLVGWSGLVSFAQATLMGIGAYSAFHFDQAGVPFPITVVLCAVIVGTVAAAMGVPGLRLRGLSLGILTLAFAAVGDGALFANRWFTGGVEAGAAVGVPDIFGLELRSNRSFYYVSWLILGLAMLGLRNLHRRASGRAFLAVKSSEPGATSAGLNASVVKLEAFAVSGMLAGIAGALFAYSLRSLATYSFAMPVSLNLAVVAVVGGVHHLTGGILAGFVYAFAPALLTDWGISGDWVWVATGAALVAIVILSPAGVGGLVNRALRVPERPEHATVRPATPVAPAGPPPLPASSAATDRALLVAEHVSQSFGGVTAISDVSLAVRAGSITSLIGPNGAGKSTMFRVITGQIRPDEGTVRFGDDDITAVRPHLRARRGIAWTYQSNQLFGDLTVLENLMVALHRHAPLDLATDAFALPVSTRRERRLAAEADQLLDLSGLGHLRDQRVAGLPFGVQRRLDVTKAIALGPSILLLDEPATGMNPEETEEFGAFLSALHQQLGITLLFIEHDMNLVKAVSDYVYVLDFGVLIAEGPPAEVLANRRVVEVYLGG